MGATESQRSDEDCGTAGNTLAALAKNACPESRIQKTYGGGKSSPLAGLYPAQTLLITLYNRMGNSRCRQGRNGFRRCPQPIQDHAAAYRLGLIEKKSKERPRRHV